MRDIRADESDSTRPLADGNKTSEWQPVAERSFEWNGNTELVETIIETVAAAEDVDVTTITAPPLIDAVPVSALEDLFFGRPVEETSHACIGQVRFRYRGMRVTVTSKGNVVVAEPVPDNADE
ncbi:HalOD1 output domain-containing protein [Halocatena marina]|uniref:HalOD1 output domain-containing protein n=1 Tax=Halocatena marina TaxID=2934937 RepID=A0ABD5YXR4_9EURY|nr:HalOD1 output domain-containing protein [Halocatena marina]